MVPWRGSLIKWLPWCPLTVLHHCHRRHYLSVWILDSRQVPRLTLLGAGLGTWLHSTTLLLSSFLGWGWDGTIMWLDSNIFFFGPVWWSFGFWGMVWWFFEGGAMFFKGDGFLRDGVMFFEGRCDGSSSTNWLPSSGSYLGAFSLVRSQVSD